MKVSENWLREWVNPGVDTETLAEQLTMAGLEVDGIEPAAKAFEGIVVACIEDFEPHPDADKLKVCQVNFGGKENIQIVCGAPNVFKGMKAPLATVGAILPGDFKIKAAKLRGLDSSGMLCSAKELGLNEDADGLMKLPADAPVGTDLREYLQLDDAIIEVDLTPNRGDCLGMRGIAREAAILNQLEFQDLQITPVEPKHDKRLSVSIDAEEGCGRYVGRVVSDINSQAETPIWMVEKLRRAGIRAIHPVVDVTNYVLIELGQPMHGFDMRQLKGGIHIRWAKDNEKLVLLDGREVEIAKDVLMIADDEKTVAIAGIMGGEHSGVADDTTDIFFECAWFDPLAIVGRARRFGLHTDASHRYERGVDPELQMKAIERATALLIDITGGEAGPLIIAEAASALPIRKPVKLRHQRVNRVLGMDIDAERIEKIFQQLGMEIKTSAAGTWQVTPPGFRFDIAIEEDLIEEIARIYGYNNIQGERPQAELKMVPKPENLIALENFKNVLIERGLQEVVTYSFVEENIEKQLNPDLEPLPLVNPISSELSVMRTSLWQGLLTALAYNQRHQQQRIRFFETGLRFVPGESELIQDNVIAGVIIGNREPEPFNGDDKVDFFDLKGDVEALLKQTLSPEEFSFEANTREALHPGQSASIAKNGTIVGWIGAVHPTIVNSLSIKGTPFVFEIELAALESRTLPAIRPWSKFPHSARDLAIVVNENISSSKLLEVVNDSSSQFLSNARIFDIYRGKGVDSGRKSVALDLIFSDSCRTLNDEEVKSEMEAILTGLNSQLGATLRE